MSTSGQITFNETLIQIITDTLILLGVYNSSETVSTNDITLCTRAINRLIKGWEGMGIHLWKESEAIIPLTVGQNIYSLYAGSSVMAGDSAVQTTLSTTATGNATSIIVTSASSMNVNDNIGITLDVGTIYWTTIQSISGTTINLVGSLTSQATAGNTIIVYTSQITRPLNITNIRYCYNSGLERRIKKAGRTEFMQLPNKAQQSPCTMYYYSPQLTTGLLYVWPTPSTVQDTLHISYLLTIQDFVNTTDNPDLPQEWLDCLVYNLAVRVAPMYGVSISQMNPDIQQQATFLLEQMAAWDTEEGSVRIVPNYRDYN